MDEKLITRRDFIRGAASSAALAAAGIPVISGALEARGEKPRDSFGAKARVVLIRAKEVLDEKGTLNTQVLQTMLDDAVARLFSTRTAGEAWKKILRPGDAVGIKSNVWDYLPTPKELEGIIRSRVVAAGVREEHVRIDDRGARESLRECAALINVRPLRSHHWAGIGGCIKNYIMFVEDRPAYHGNSCASLGAIWNLPIVKGKTRLNILVVLTPQFYGRGPHHFDPRYVWNYKGLMVSTDPVALDALGASLLIKKRIACFGENRPVTPTNHIQAADTDYGVGVSDLKKIELVKLGWIEDILI